MAKTSAKDERPGGVVVMAAGLGTRMKSSLPKALNPIGGRPLLFHILERVREALPGVPVAVVVGHGADEVRAADKRRDEHQRGQRDTAGEQQVPAARDCC